MKSWMMGLICFLFATHASAVADFEVDTEGFTQGAQAAGTVVTVEDSGPAGTGDSALRVTAGGAFTRIHAFNRTNAEFLGDFIGDGVTAVQFDAMAPQTNGQGLTLFGVVFRNSIQGQNFGDRWVTTDSAAIPADGAWTTYTLDLAQEGDFVHPAGANAFATDFAGVEHFGLRHQLAANQAGGTSLAAGTQVFFDNIELLPEPGAVAGALAACLALLSLRRVSRSFRAGGRR